jgi:predicted PurR-regulated permease PerM
MEFDRTVLQRVRRNLFFILVAATTLGFLGLIRPFLTTVFWAAVLAIIFFGLYEKVKKWVKGRRSLAALLTTILILFFVIIPFTLLGIALFQQGMDIFTDVQSGALDPTIVVNYVEESLPKISETLANFGVTADDLRERLSNAAIEVSSFVANRALTVGGSIINIFVEFTLMLYLLFFFFRDGRELMRTIIDTIPMGNVRERALFQRFAQVSRATLKGTLVVAIVQGSIGGVLFAILGIPAALLWGVAMTLLALLPVGGSAIVWFPAAIILFAQGEIGKAITMLIVGSLIIGLIDNLLRPILVGRDTEMPDYLVLLSTLGGITFFGLSGFVVGPTIAALFITVWEMMGKDYGGKNS